MGSYPASMKEKVLVENKGYLKDCNPGFKERGEKLTFLTFFGWARATYLNLPEYRKGVLME